MRASDWSREILLRSDWLLPRVAIYTTHVSLFVFVFSFIFIYLF